MAEFILHLSYGQFAGAAQSLGAGALLVNPWNITEVAAAIGKALNMSDEEREKRHQINFLHVTEHTAQEWAEFFVRYVNIDSFLSIFVEYNYGIYFHGHQIHLLRSVKNL